MKLTCSMLTGRISSPEPNDLVHDMMFDTGVYNMFQAPNTPGRVNFIMIHIIFHRPIYQILKKKNFCDPSTIHHLPSRIPSDPSLVTINSPAFTGRVSPQHWLKHPQCLLPLRQYQRLRRWRYLPRWPCLAKGRCVKIVRKLSLCFLNIRFIEGSVMC